ncbi:MAG: hypothetical protein NTY35_05950 [Planctomycetota bacterium]|nr:hypothetical protein [Planctomycetota bacterium]
MRPLRLLPFALSAALCSPSARAELQQPGSLLVFPLADARAGSTSVLSLTNVNPALASTIRVEVVHIANCLQFNRDYSLPASDMLSVTLSQTMPTGGQGFLYVFAKDLNGRAISYDHLIGSILMVDGVAGIDMDIPAVTFDSPLAEGALTDLDGDGIRDLNGTEYAQVAGELMFPRFLGQSAGYASELVLVNLTGGSAFTASVNILVANDDRDVFSTQYSFNCWSRVRLASISSIFNNSFLLGTGHNPAENVLGREAGWFRVNGTSASSSAKQLTDPAILAVLIEPGAYSNASLPYGRGLQNNGDLYPTSVNGDPTPVFPGSGDVFLPPGGLLLGN